MTQRHKMAQRRDLLVVLFVEDRLQESDKMNSMRIALLSLFIFCCRSYLSAQVILKNELNNYKDSIRKQILNEIRHRPDAHNGTVYNKIIVVPSCTYNATLQYKNIDDFYPISILRDTVSTRFELILSDSMIYALPALKYINFPYISGVEDFEQINENNFQLKEVQFAQKLSKTYFFLNILSRTPIGNRPLAYIENNKLKLVDFNLGSNNHFQINVYKGL
jgi:hypothetical protein